MNLRKEFKSLLTIFGLTTFSNFQSLADSHYLGEVKPILTSEAITNLRASENLITWQDSIFQKNALKAFNIKDKTTNYLATSQSKFIDIYPGREDVLWYDNRQPNRYFIWNPSEGTKQIDVSCSQLTRVIRTQSSLISACGYDSSPEKKITIEFFNGQVKHITESYLLGANESSIFIQNISSDGIMSLAKIDLENDKKEIIYTSTSTGTILTSKQNFEKLFVHSGLNSSWIIGEKVLGQSQLETSLMYHNSKSTFLLKRNPTSVKDLEVSNKGVFWNELNNTKKKFDLYFWSETKGKNLITQGEDSISVDEFSVVDGNIYMTDGKKLYVATLEEYPSQEPNITYKYGTNPRRINFTVTNPVQGKEYTLQRSIGNIMGSWRDIESRLTNFTIDNKNPPKDAVTYTYTIPSDPSTGRETIFPNEFFRVEAKTPQ